ncbi:MAG: thiamine pyrophosphate-binding protein [Betaproteobacteria bacterium]|nr:thiamine pyrophosphate-binding protein [Betaproteobacteria bacterium]
MAATTTAASKYAEQLTDWLVELGYTHCFFVAGGNIMHLLDGARTRFTCVPVVHEVAAGIAVEYFNEAGGKGRAFAMVTAGPGVSNIITAMSGAWLESRELLVIAGQVKSEDLATGGVRQRGIQEIDGVGLAAPVAKHSVQMKKPMPKAEFVSLVNAGSTGRPGPVFIELCLDAQGAPPLKEQAAEVKAQINAVASETEIDLVITQLKSAQRPILLIGGGVSRKLARALQTELTSSGIPVMTTWNAADRIDAAHPSYLGRPNTWGQRAANLLVAQADLVIAVGTRLGMQQTGFNWQQFGRNAYVVHVDIDRAELDKGHPKIDLPVCADADDFLTRLLPKVRGDWETWVSYAQEVRNALPLNDPANETGNGFLSPFDFYADLVRLSESDDVVIPCSSGGANSVSMQVIEQKLGQVIITDKGLASMGYGLAGAIGASMAHPGKRTFLIEGDGGFSQNLQELATVAVNNLPIKTFIFANNGYGSIRMTQKNYFDGAYLGCDTETGLGFPDWDMLFQSFGISTITLDKDWSTNKEVLSALRSDKPYGFIVPIDPLQTYWPKITSRIVEGGGMESNPLHMMSPDLAPDLFTQVTKYL